MRYVLPTVRRAVLAAALGVALTVTTACTTDEPRREPEPPRVDRDTIAAADLGDRLTITARVVERLDDRSFVVQDVDLPVGGLLVVGRTATEVRPPILVTVRGAVGIFHYDTHSDGGLGPRSRYERFEGLRAVVATSVTVWGEPVASVAGSDGAV